MKHRRREGSKNKDMTSCRKIDHRNFWIFFWQKKYGDDEQKKKGKEEVWKEKWDQEQKREKKNEVKQ